MSLIPDVRAALVAAHAFLACAISLGGHEGRPYV